MSKSWNQISFLVEPEMLRELLEEFRPDLFPGGFVPEDFSPQNYEPFIQEYSRAVESILTGAKDHPVFIVGLQPPGSAYKLAKARRSGFFYVESRSAIINLRDEGILFDLEKGRLLTNCHPSLFFGLQLFCRKQVASPDERASEELFQNMVAWINGRTRPVSVRSPERIHRTKLRISPKLREWLRSCQALNHIHLEIV